MQLQQQHTLVFQEPSNTRIAENWEGETRKKDKSVLGWASAVVLILGLGLGASSNGIAGMALIAFAGYLFFRSAEP